MHYIKRKSNIAVLFLLSVLLLGILLFWGINKRISYIENLSEEELIDSIEICNGINDLYSVNLVNMGEGKYSVFLPNEMNDSIVFYFDTFKKICINQSNEIYNGDRLDSLVCGKPYQVELIGWNENKSAAFELTIYKISGIPTIYISTDEKSTEIIDGDKLLQEKAMVMTVDMNGNVECGTSCDLSSRGQTSFYANQKSYNFSCKNKISPFGLGEGTEWSLLANYKDCMQQMRNKITFDLAQRLGLLYSPESHFCNLYIDGQYRGLYLLTKRDMADVRYSFEMNSGFFDEDTYFATAMGYPIVIKKSKGLSENEIINVSESVTSAVECLLNPEMSDSNLKEYFDFDSWAKYYILQDFAVQWDLEYNSFKFYRKMNAPQLFAGPVWDFDLAYGELYIGHYPELTNKTMWVADSRKGWLYSLTRSSGFSETLNNIYWNDFEPNLDNYLENVLPQLIEANKSSIRANCVRWNRAEDDYETAAKELCAWINNRKTFINDYYHNPEQFCCVTFNFDKWSMTYYVRTGEQLGYLPLSQYGEVDYSSDENGEISSWVDENGDVISGSTIIDKDVSFYACYNEVEGKQ